MGRLVWCRLCTSRYEHLGGALPETCPTCGESAHWSAIEVPKREFALSENDRRLLRALRIKADV
jgi:hypothetical protein